MSSAATRLRRAVESFRRGQGLLYLSRIGGLPEERVPARQWLASEVGIEALLEARKHGELSDAEDAALCAHMARAALEARFDAARSAALRLSARGVRVGNEGRRLDDVCLEWSKQPSLAQRNVLTRALEPHFHDFARSIVAARAEAERHAGSLLQRLSPARHADAGPVGGNAEAAERWLAQTQDLAEEAFGFVRREHRVEAEQGLETLFALTGASLSGLVPRPGRMRRLAADWEPLGLRRQLRSFGRTAADHPGPSPTSHVVTLSAPSEIRVSASALEFGLASELLAADAIGRATGYAHASAALPVALRHAAVGTVSRTLGQLGVLRFADPLFLRKTRGLSARESHTVARLSAAFCLAESRLLAASVLVRAGSDDKALERASELASRALLGSVPVGWGSILVTRLSPGGPFRAKMWAPGFAFLLRERFDEDWFLNPRAAEPLRGALARAGEFSVEAWAEEQGVHLEQGPKRLAELF